MFTTATTFLALAASLVDSTTALAIRNTSSSAPASYSSPYKLVESYQHPDFFDGFTLFSGQPDPTHGYVNYVDYSTANSQELIGWVLHEDTNASHAYVAVDSENIASNGRDSVRLISKASYNVGLLTVIDVWHAPSAKAVWPAVWYLADSSKHTWPEGGEQDIMEWVNNNQHNSMTLHTSAGCTVEQFGHMQNTDCNSGPNGDNDATLGCSVEAVMNNQVQGAPFSSAGGPFNGHEGGIYVHEWTTEGVSVWLFPRDQQPADLQSGTPNPASWTQTPIARFSGSGCDFAQYFQDQQLIINIDVCGDWSGDMFPGGNSSCAAFAQNNPQGFRNAYFDFASIKVYSSTSETRMNRTKIKRDTRFNRNGVVQVSSAEQRSQSHHHDEETKAVGLQSSGVHSDSRQHGQTTKTVNSRTDNAHTTAGAQSTRKGDPRVQSTEDHHRSEHNARSSEHPDRSSHSHDSTGVAASTTPPAHRSHGADNTDTAKLTSSSTQHRHGHNHGRLSHTHLHSPTETARHAGETGSANAHSNHSVTAHGNHSTTSLQGNQSATSHGNHSTHPNSSTANTSCAGSYPYPGCSETSSSTSSSFASNAGMTGWTIAAVPLVVLALLM